MGSGPAPGPTLKRALCHTRPVGGTGDKYHLRIEFTTQNDNEKKKVIYK